MLEFIIVDLEYWRFGEGVLQSLKSSILVMAPLEWHILARQVHQWSGNTSKSFDESSVEVGESKESLYILHRRQLWPQIHSVYLVVGDLNPFGADDMA